MKITVSEICADNLQDANKCHESFAVDCMLDLSIENGRICYTARSVPPYEKRYPPNEVDYSTYINNTEQSAFFAYVDGELAGELIMRKWWNCLAYIEDISVKAKFRRNGIGSALLDRAIGWAKDHHLPGVMLETQNNNVAACRFYERCGFELAGFDRYLYKALNPDREEIALYWYLLFDSTPEAAANPRTN